MKNTVPSNSQPSLNFLLIAIYLLAFLGIVLLLYGAMPLLGDVLYELKDNAAARMLN